MRVPDGFTLIEMVVTVAVISILAAVAIPLYRDYIDTAQRQAMVERINGLRPFIENARIDAAVPAYPGGTYDGSTATNDFEAIGYRMPGDDDGIKLVVAAGACAGGLTNCYKITATNADGLVGVYENGTVTW